MPLLVLPAMIGVLVDQAGMSESFAGWSASLNFLGVAIVGLVISLKVHHINLRKLGRLALVLAIFADLISATTIGSTTIFLVVRVIAGITLGAGYIAAVSSFARYDDYERGFGIFVTLQFMISGTGLYLVPVYSDWLGASGLFYLFAVLDLLALSLCHFLPSKIVAKQGSQGSASELRLLLTLSAVLAIAGFTLFEAANNAQFTYIERFGVMLGLTDHQFGLALLVASLAGIPGAFMIVIVGQRFGMIGPLTLGFLIAVAGLFTLLEANSYTAFFTGCCFMVFSWAFCLPFIQSLLANIDRSGSAIAAGTSFSAFGAALGPGTAALVVASTNVTHVFRLSVGLFVLAYVCFYYASSRRQGDQTGPQT